MSRRQVDAEIARTLEPSTCQLPPPEGFGRREQTAGAGAGRFDLRRDPCPRCRAR
jgi:hypothetical protein